MDAKIPVIFDTDIGTDIDDTWALAYLLKSPELDVRLITTTTGDTWNRAKIVARFLELAGRTDIPIGVGLPLESSPNYQENWTVDYDLDKYPGTILENGVQALVQTIRDAGEQVSLIEAGPFPNTAAALISDPELIQSSRVVGMFGSVYRGYFGDPQISAEYDVRMYPHACRRVLESAWDIVMAPLDTCGSVQILGECYQQILNSHDPLIKAVTENYRIWTIHNKNPLYQGFNPAVESSILFDLVPIFLAFSGQFIELQQIRISVSDDGFTNIDPSGTLVRAAVEWKDYEGFLHDAVGRLTSG